MPLFFLLLKLNELERHNNMNHRDQTPFRYLVGHGFKEYGGCGDFFLLSHEAVGEVTSVWEVQSHDPSVGLHKGRVNSKVSRRALTWKKTTKIQKGGKTAREPGDREKTDKVKNWVMSESSLWYPSMAARWRPISPSPGRKLLAPFSDRVSPARQHTPYRHSTWMPGLDQWHVKVKAIINTS